MHQPVDLGPSNRWDEHYTPPEDAPCLASRGSPQHIVLIDTPAGPKRFYVGVRFGRFRFLLSKRVLPIPAGRTLYEAICDVVLRHW